MDFLLANAAEISLETLERRKRTKKKNSVIGATKNGKTVYRMCSLVMCSSWESFLRANIFIEALYLSSSFKPVKKRIS